MANRTDEYKDNPIRSYVEDDLLEEIKEFSDNSGMKQSPAIRQLIRLGLQSLQSHRAELRSA